MLHIFVQFVNQVGDSPAIDKAGPTSSQPRTTPPPLTWQQRMSGPASPTLFLGCSSLVSSINSWYCWVWGVDDKTHSWLWGRVGSVWERLDFTQIICHGVFSYRVEEQNVYTCWNQVCVCKWPAVTLQVVWDNGTYRIEVIYLFPSRSLNVLLRWWVVQIYLSSGGVAVGWVSK